MSHVAIARIAESANRHSTAGSSNGSAVVLLPAIGCLALVLGLLVYLTDRDAGHAVLIPTFGALAGRNLFGGLGQWLSSFVHPFAFSLFTAASLPSRSAWRYGACAAWCAMNVAFEVGQHPHVSARLAEVLQASLGQSSLTRTLTNYFLRGSFDVGDIVAAVVGSMVAAGVLCLVQRESENDHVS